MTLAAGVPEMSIAALVALADGGIGAAGTLVAESAVSAVLLPLQPAAKNTSAPNAKARICHVHGPSLVMWLTPVTSTPSWTCVCFALRGAVFSVSQYRRN